MFSRISVSCQLHKIRETSKSCLTPSDTKFGENKKLENFHIQKRRHSCTLRVCLRVVAANFDIFFRNYNHVKEIIIVSYSTTHGSTNNRVCNIPYLFRLRFIRTLLRKTKKKSFLFFFFFLLCRSLPSNVYFGSLTHRLYEFPQIAL